MCIRDRVDAADDFEKDAHFHCYNPLRYRYEIDGDRVRIDIRSVTVHEASPRTFDAENYAGYEWIDFR